MSQGTAIAQGAATVNAKKAFRPIPGARAKGNFAQSPIAIHPMNLAIDVANSASLNGMPVAANIDGFTSRMYAIVRKVAPPALISVATSLPASVTPNILSNCSIFLTYFLFKQRST